LGGRGATGGYPYQFFYYSAFSRGDHEGKLAGRNVKLAPPSPASGVMRDGESLVQQHANTGHFATPYKFNAKELDMETGNYYYGARYYNPQTSIWFGVDPLAAKYPHVTPYNFVMNNPVFFLDPDGREVVPGNITPDVKAAIYARINKAKKSSVFSTVWNHIHTNSKNKYYIHEKDYDDVLGLAYFVGEWNYGEYDAVEDDYFIGDNGNYGGDITYSNSYFTHITDSDIPSFLDAINQAMVIEELVHAGQYEFIVTTMGNSSEHKIPTLDNEFEAKVITGIILQQMGYSFKDLSDLDLPTQYGFQISSGKATLKQYSEVMNQWIEIQKQLESEGKQFYDYDDAGSTSPQYLNSILNN
jgi:RHS repeat-associated protein